MQKQRRKKGGGSGERETKRHEDGINIIILSQLAGQHFRNTGILKNCRPRACVFVKKQTTTKAKKKPLAPHQGKLMWPQNKRGRCQPPLPAALRSMWWGVELVGNFPIRLFFFPTEKNVDSVQLGLNRKQAARLPSPPAHTARPKLVQLLLPLPSRSS